MTAKNCSFWTSLFLDYYPVLHFILFNELCFIFILLLFTVVNHWSVFVQVVCFMINWLIIQIRDACLIRLLRHSNTAIFSARCHRSDLNPENLLTTVIFLHLVYFDVAGVNIEHFICKMKINSTDCCKTIKARNVHLALIVLQHFHDVACQNLQRCTWTLKLCKVIERSSSYVQIAKGPLHSIVRRFWVS